MFTHTWTDKTNTQTHTNTQRHKYTLTHMDRQTQSHTDTHTERHKYTLTHARTDTHIHTQIYKRTYIHTQICAYTFRHCFNTITDGVLGTEVLLTLVKMEEADVTQRTFPHLASSLPPKPPDPLNPHSPDPQCRAPSSGSCLRGGFDCRQLHMGPGHAGETRPSRRRL